MRNYFKLGLLAAVVGSTLGLGTLQASSQDLELTIMAPAGAGGGWDSAVGFRAELSRFFHREVSHL